MRSFVVRHTVATFITLALGFQFFIVLMAWSLMPQGGHLHDHPAAHMVFRFRVFGPLLFVVAITAWLEGVAGLRKLFEPFLNWKVSPWWYGLALTWKLVFTYLGMFIITLFGLLPWPGWITGDFLLPLLKNMPFIVGIAIVEETSWMKFGVTRLHERFTALQTSLIIGLSWGLWYLPMMILGEGVPDGIPWWVFLVSMFSLTVFLNWAYNQTRSGTVLLVMQILSNCAFFVTPVLPAWTGSPLFISAFVGVFLVAAVYLLVRYGARDLSTRERAKWSDPKPAQDPALAMAA